MTQAGQAMLSLDTWRKMLGLQEHIVYALMQMANTREDLRHLHHVYYAAVRSGVKSSAPLIPTAKVTTTDTAMPD